MLVDVGKYGRESRSYEWRMQPRMSDFPRTEREEYGHRPNCSLCFDRASVCRDHRAAGPPAKSVLPHRHENPLPLVGNLREKSRF